jgi:hypothetical protein
MPYHANDFFLITTIIDGKDDNHATFFPVFSSSAFLRNPTCYSNFSLVSTARECLAICMPQQNITNQSSFLTFPFPVIDVRISGRPDGGRA